MADKTAGYMQQGPLAAPGWGFCSNRDCQCWLVKGDPCEEYVDNIGDPHPFLRCHRCGHVEQSHLAPEPS